MKCTHKRIKSVNGVVSCAECGEVFPDYFKTAGNVHNQPDITPADAVTDKAPAKKKTAKNVK